MNLKTFYFLLIDDQMIWRQPCCRADRWRERTLFFTHQQDERCRQHASWSVPFFFFRIQTVDTGKRGGYFFFFFSFMLGSDEDCIRSLNHSVLKRLWRRRSIRVDTWVQWIFKTLFNVTSTVMQLLCIKKTWGEEKLKPWENLQKSNRAVRLNILCPWQSDGCVSGSSIFYSDGWIGL